jgi:hypothetical protein
MELGAARDTIRDQSDSGSLRDVLFHVTFEPHRDPAGILAWVWAHGLDQFVEQVAGPEVTRILNETHRRCGIPGVVQDHGNGRWLFRWDDQN